MSNGDVPVQSIVQAANQFAAALANDPTLLQKLEADPVGTLNSYGADLPALPQDLVPTIAQPLADLYQANGGPTTRGVSTDDSSIGCWACYVGISAVLVAAVVAAGILIVGTDGLAAPPIVTAVVGATGLDAAAVVLILRSVAAAGGVGVAAAIDAAVGGICQALGACVSDAFTGDPNWSVTMLNKNGGQKSDAAPALAVMQSLFCVHKGKRNDNRLWCTSLPAVGGDWTTDTLMRADDPATGPTFNTVKGPALATYRGSLYCAYTNLDDGGRIYYTTSADGNRWSKPTQIPNAPATGAEPALAVYDQNALFCVFTDSDQNLLYTYSTDGTLWMPQPKPVGGCQAQEGVALADFAERLWCVFRQPGGDDLYYITLEAPDVWQEKTPFPADHRSSAKPGLAAYRGTLCAVYRGGGITQLFYATFDEPSQSWLPDRQAGTTLWLTDGPAGIEFSGRLLCLYPTGLEYLAASLKELSSSGPV